MTRTRILLLLVVLIVALPVSGCDQETRDGAEMLIDFSFKLFDKLISESELRQRQAEAATVAADLLAGGRLTQVTFTDPANANEAWPGAEETLVVALIDAATRSVDIATFQFNLDTVADALLAAHARGVRVRLVYDDEYALRDPQLERLIGAGIPAEPDLRDAYMHNKFMVIDGLLVWTGSANFTFNDFYRNNNNAIVVASPQIADDYTLEFEEMFDGAFGPVSPADTPFRQVAVGDALIEIYFSPEDEPYERIVELVGSAQESIQFMAFSFTNAGIGEMMLERARAGIPVTGIFETRNANDQYSECPVMRDSGLDVRIDGNPYLLHHKVIIIDHEVVIMGSFNFSNNAVTSNDENVLIIHDPAIAGLYEEEFALRMAESVLPLGEGCMAP